ncbi:MAG: type I methionyl aminopeptidase [Chloroflexi bacterium]|nr:type I methionyl aminopeptidase [Chloroflexota bacterium]|tara:strand:+ start:1472 stop:2236 length:765 start_codon:yes stop_codon:yes gene_type:complete
MIGFNKPKGINLKTEQELKFIREAGRMLREVKNIIKQNIVEGITTKELDSIAENAINKLGGKPGFKGLYGFPGTICSSFNEEIVHGIPNSRKVKDGDILSVDCGVIYEEFNSDSAFTVSIGKIPSNIKTLINTTQEALKLGIQEAKPGNHIGDIGHSIEKYSKSKGFSVVKEYVGHGIGKKLHEDPQIPNYGQKSSGPKILSGMALAIEPMLIEGNEKTVVDEDGWTVKTADSSMSAHFEDTIIITNDSFEIVT